MKWNLKQNLNQSLFWFISLLCLTGYYWLCFKSDRSNFVQVISLYSTLFLGYILFVRIWDENVKLIIGLGVLFRIIAFFSFPNLSDDVYRFIWDGRSMINGVNPFLHTPSELTQVDWFDPRLYENLNSPNYFTVYPPVLQYIFSIGAISTSGSYYTSALVMKLFIFFAELGSLTLLIKLFKQFEIHQKNIAWYALNPLVIVELCSNVHFEAIMIFFLLLAVWWMIRNRITLSAIAMGFAICTKLLPLMFLPFLIKRLGLKESIKYFLITSLICLLLFAPFLSLELIQNLFTSIDLYFQKFEFNASIYYIVRWIGFQIKGWNIIQIAGPALSIITTLSILIIAFRERTSTIKSLIPKMSISLLIYFGLATIVHPWYATTLVALVPFWKWRFPIVWSAVIPLSYFAYSNPDYTENLWLIAFEYSIIPLFVFYEWRKGWNEEY